MKNFLSALYSILESFGKARAASCFVRQGNYEAAKKVMQE